MGFLRLHNSPFPSPAGPDRGPWHVSDRHPCYRKWRI